MMGQIYASLRRRWRRRVTLMLVPAEHGKLRSFHISLFFVDTVAFICLLCLTSVIYTLANYGTLQVHMRALEASLEVVQEHRLILHEQTAQQELRLQELAQQTESLQERLLDLELLGAEVREILPDPPDVRSDNQSSDANEQFGIGGGGDDELDSWLGFQLDQLMARVAEQREELQALRGSLEAYNHRLAHTPSIWPVEGRITSHFGQRVHPVTGQRQMHWGLDIGAWYDTPIVAPAAGRVVEAQYHGGYGYYVKIDHGYGIQTVYAHNRRNLVRAGDYVQRGDRIALVGSTGQSTGPHLHYEVHVNGERVNPLRYLP